MNKLKTERDLLKHFLHRNEHGVWFVWCEDDKFYNVPRWIWPYLDKVLGKDWKGDDV